jgi:CheY-like chemotaxis protein
MVGNTDLSIQYHTSDCNRGQELSLNLALKLLESMGCDVVISNTVAAGFDLSFTCDATEDTSILPTSTPVAHAGPTPNTAPLHVLITDDNAFTCRFLTKILTSLQYTSEIAVDGVECVDKLKSTQHFDVVLLDSMMPRLDGPGVLLYAKDHHVHVPFICVTANASESDTAKLYDLGAKAVLGKPVSSDKLKSTIDLVLSQC